MGEISPIETMTEEYDYCTACGERMTVKDHRTNTHPLVQCYIAKIEKLQEEVLILKVERETLLWKIENLEAKIKDSRKEGDVVTFIVDE